MRKLATTVFYLLLGFSLVVGCSNTKPVIPQPPAIAQLGSSRSSAPVTQLAVKRYTGTFADGATYLIEVPKNWNRTFLLWSHGYVGPPGSPNPADDGNNSFGEPAHSYLLSNGYALGGSSYSSAGFVIHDALLDQIAVLDTFNSVVGSPRRTIAWGWSLGGLITAGLIQNYPGRFSGALSFCGILAGSVGVFNEWVDQAFALNTLLASVQLEVVHIANPSRDISIASNALTNAQTSPQGRARIDLVAALSDLPGWTNVNSTNPNPPEPSRTDYAAREANNFASLQSNLVLFFPIRQDFETRAGGNLSWNTGVNYRRQLERSVDYVEVKTLYAQADLSLDADLEALNNATRITADPAALEYATQNVTFNGDISVPVLTLHTIGDDVANVQNEQAYAAVVRDGHDNNLLRERFVHRPGHLTFTSAEIVVSLQALLNRVDSRNWQGIQPQDLNRAALELGPKFNSLFGGGPPEVPAFTEYEPAPFLRTFDLGGDER